MTPERRDAVVVTLLGAAAGADAAGNDWFAQDLRDAATDLEAVNELHRATAALGALPGPDQIQPKNHDAASPRQEERLSDESWRITKAILAGVRKELARGCNPEDGEPDDHQAVRTVEDECERARSEETRLREENAALRKTLMDVRTWHTRIQECMPDDLWDRVAEATR